MNWQRWIKIIGVFIAVIAAFALWIVGSGWLTYLLGMPVEAAPLVGMILVFAAAAATVAAFNFR